MSETEYERRVRSWNEQLGNRPDRPPRQGKPPGIWTKCWRCGTSYLSHQLSGGCPDSLQTIRDGKSAEPPWTVSKDKS